MSIPADHEVCTRDESAAANNTYAMDRQIAQCLADYLIANPRDAAALIDACNRITEVFSAGAPLRKTVSLSDFSGREWCALVDVANLLSFFVVPMDHAYQEEKKKQKRVETEARLQALRALVAVSNIAAE